MTSKPRVFLADDTQSSFDFFKALAEKEGWPVAGYAADYASFINRAPQSDADVMFVSSGFLGVMNARDRRSLKDEMPERVVLAICDLDDFAELKGAVRAGARDCLRAGDPEEFVASAVYEYFAEATTLRDKVAGRAVFDDTPPRPAKARGGVVAFCGADGGTGKSFLSLQAAGMAAVHAGAKTCLVDFDLRCGALSAATLHDAPGARSLGDLADVIDEIRPSQIESLLRDHNCGFSVVCGPAPEITDIADLFARVVEPLRAMFDAVIVDFPPNPGPGFPIGSIDTFYIVMTPDAVSAACARRMASDISAGREDADISGIINRCDRPGALKADEVKRLSGLEIAADVPEDEGAGRMFDERGAVLAKSTNLSLVKALVPVVQRIKDFDELAKTKMMPPFREWRPPWAV